MKTILTLLLVGSLCVTGWANTNAMLRGIRIVETQDQLHPPRGKLGERGPYQFRRSTWRMHTSTSFDLAENREVANTVAKRHYAWIQSQLRAAGVEPTPYKVAAAWNAGVNAVIRGRVPAVTRDYAARVVNLAGTFLAPEPAREEPAPETMVATTTAPQTEPVATTIIEATAEQPASPVATATTVAETSTAELAADTEDDVPVEYVYTVPPTANDPVQVRFHTSPIMLAFHKPAPTEPAAETAASQIVVAANDAPLGNDTFPAIGRM